MKVKNHRKRDNDYHEQKISTIKNEGKVLVETYR